MSDKPNKFLYYSVLTGSFVLSAFAVLAAYYIIVNSKDRSEQKRSLQPPVYYKVENGQKIELNSGQTNTTSSSDITYSGDNVAGWLNGVLIDSYEAEDTTLTELQNIKIYQHFTKVSWWEYERFIEDETQADGKITYGTMNNFKVNELGKNEVGTDSWTVTLPFFILKDGQEKARTLKVGIEQESFNGQKEEMKITSWQMM